MRLDLALAAMVLAACGAAAPRSVAPLDQAVGLRELTARDPVAGGPLPLAIFYPASGAAAHTARGPYDLAAAADLPARAGRVPLIALSHGHGGTRWGHHDLAEALARAGFAVVVLDHPGDRYGDEADHRSDRVLLGRAAQLSAAIDAALADAQVGPHLDPARIGVAGFSAGGFTALLAAGARPDLGRFDAYCAQHPADADLCAGPLAHELAGLPVTADPRVRAAFVMAPLALPFGPGAFAAVRAPIFLAYATADRVLVPRVHAEAILPALATLRGSRRIEGADHFVFLAPCGPALAAAAPPLCVDPPPIDRAAVHRQLAADAVAFFSAAL